MGTERRNFDLILFGATSFVGQILTRRLVERYGTDGALRWAIAGRDPAKLTRVAAETGAEVERLVADAADSAALADLARSTKVIVSTVGPFAVHGSPLVAAAVAAGTDYCDSTGEPQWIRRMIDEHTTAAEVSGARLVPACGFDSVPSDLGVWHLQQLSMERFGEPCETVAMRVASLRGGASGGTMASMMNVMDEASSDPTLRGFLSDARGLNPVDLRTGPISAELRGPKHDNVSGQWVAPFVMAGVNVKVVHRTNALLGQRWGPNFTYDEAMSMGTGPLGAAKAGGLSAGLVAGMGLAAIGPTRRVLSRYVLPKPGQGPSVQSQEKGSFDLRFFGTTRSGSTIRTRVTGDRDPGYAGTARMLAEAAGTLVETSPDDLAGGFWTPAAAFGDRLVERLEAHAGIRFDAVD